MENNKAIMAQVSDAMRKAGETASETLQSMTDFFQGNPFESEVGKKIGMYS
jgi:hypothetical protein